MIFGAKVVIILEKKKNTLLTIWLFGSISLGHLA